jgi:hypothetical protein
MPQQASGVFAICATAAILMMTGCTPNYSGEVRNALKRVYRSDFPGYTLRGTPVGNFGVGTMYQNDIQNPSVPIEERWLIGHPNTWFVDAVTEQEKSVLLDKIIEKGPMGSAALTEDISRKLSLDLAVPAIKDIVSVGTNINTEKGVKVTLRASDALNHRMNWDEFQIALRDGKLKPSIAEHVQKRDFVIAADDIVFSGYKALVTVDIKVNPELNAKLTEAVGKVIGQDTSMKIKISSSHAGTFEVETVSPVVAAILFKTPPPAATQATANISAWPTVTLDPQRLTQLEHRLAEK